ncbi:MAG: hypothetical protein QOF82_3077 [Frankiales bacterium]|nr:hypothetical protein [Frankiales bacterium]MDX6213990.1 hypothetical protein [Frankiales bacterium]
MEILSRSDLRAFVLGASVLHELDFSPIDDGVRLEGVPDLDVTWDELAAAVGDATAGSQVGRQRMARWLLSRRWIAERSLDELTERARPVGLPVGHLLHPGEDWVQLRVLGRALDLGLGFVGLMPGRPDDVVVVPEGVLGAYGLESSRWWPAALSYLEDMGAMAVVRWRRNPRHPLRPMGDCDVVSLLGSAVLRGALAGDQGGMRAIAVPMRSRGWLDLRGIDPAFSLAAAALTDPAERGFTRPLLLTVDEVVLVPEGGRPAEVVLRDSAAGTNDLRDVLYR